MARPLKYDSPRERIIGAARAMILQHGPAVSLRAVAAEADFGVATLYQHFDSKAALLAAVAAEANGGLFERLQAAARATAPGEAQLMAVAAAYLSFARERRDDFLLIFDRRLSRRQAGSEVPAESCFFVLRRVVEGAVRAGLIDAQLPTDGATYAVWTLIHGQAMLQSTVLEVNGANFSTVDQLALRSLLEGLRRI